MKNKVAFRHAPCPTCSGLVVGRTDKRFCSVKCKNEHHKNARTYLKTRYGEIQKRIHRNFVLLEGIVGPTATGMDIHKDILFKFGFDLSICTGNKIVNGEQWHELGNYHFKIDAQGIVSVNRMEKLSEKMPGFFERYEIDFPKGMRVGGSGDDTPHRITRFCRRNE